VLKAGLGWASEFAVLVQKVLVVGLELVWAYSALDLGQVLELGLGLTFFVFEQPVLGLGLMLADFAVVKLVLVLDSALAIPPSAPEMWMEGEDSDLRAWLGSRSRGRIPG